MVGGGHGSGGKVWGLISLHDQHPGAFEASLIRAGVRWRDVGQDSFTWGDCLALIENLAWDDPLSRATRPDEWAWHNPEFDPLVTILEVLMQINAKTPVQDRKMKAALPKRIPRPWEKAKRKPEAVKPGRSWEDMEKWVASRIAPR